ncbi:MAG: HAMP domain-containing sensor histidine kinase [bacterium]|nr:HAMP domain-containing sensor histidine kinase [bacterium]
MNIPNEPEKPILDKTEGNGKSLFAAIMVATLSFLLFFVLQVMVSKQHLNIIISGNKALALNAFLLLGIFVIFETVAQYSTGAKKLVHAGRGMGVIGLVNALMHVALVVLVLTNEFPSEWLSKESLSILFAKVSVLILVILFAGLIQFASKKLGSKQSLYLRFFGYLALVTVFLHTFLLSKASYYSAGQTLIGTVRQLELTFIGLFLAIIILIYGVLYFINKQISLGTKIIIHTFLYFTVSAIIIGSYIGISYTQRRYEETFHTNRHIVEHVREYIKDGNLESSYQMADSLTDTYQHEISVFFIDSDGTVLHHSEKKKEDTKYRTFADSDKTKDGYGWDIKYKENGSEFLDTVVSLAPQKGYLVVSSDYSKISAEFNKQIVYSSVVIAAVFILTGFMTLMFTRINIITPIKKITDASKRIAEGDFNTQIRVKSNDELMVLANVFTNMSQTLQKQINDLMKMDKLKNEFIAIASHNLRTPLTTLRGYLDMLGAEKLTKKQKETLQKAERSATALTSLTEGLVNITSLETQGVKIEKDSVDLTAIIENVLEEVSSQANAKNIKIENKIGNERVKTIGDQAKLKQAFIAVLENAIKFNKEGGKVVLEKIIDDTKQPTIGRKEVIITIEDTGIGIAKNEKVNVFQKFNRGTSTYTYEYEGVGLGLYLAKLIIQAHHGRIWFESAEGKGTTFYISLTTSEDNDKNRK